MKMSVASSPLSFIINANSTMPMYSCSDCSYKTSSLRKLGRHKSVNHAGVKYRCEHCDFVTGYQSNYYRHRKQVHSNVMHHNQPVKLQPNVTIVQQQQQAKPIAISRNNFVADRKSFPPMNNNNNNTKNDMPQLHAFPKPANKPKATPPTQISTAPIGGGSGGGDWICSECGAEFATKLRLDVHINTYHNDFVKSESGKDKLDLSVKPRTLYGNSVHNNNNESSSSFAGYVKEEQQESPSKFFLQNAKVQRRDLFPTSENASSANFVDEEQAILSAAAIKYLTKTNLRRNVDDQQDDVETPLDLSKNESDASATSRNRRNSSSKSPPIVDDVLPTADFDGLYRCNLCPYTSSESARYRKHVRCHQTTAPTKCDYCSFSTVYSWNLDRHVRCHKTSSRYTCRRCTFSQNTRQSMSFHLQHHHNVTCEEKSVQTDENDEIDFDVDIGFEPFIFEKHAVVRNEDFFDGRQSSLTPDSAESKQTTDDDVTVCQKDEITAISSDASSASKNVARKPSTTINYAGSSSSTTSMMSEKTKTKKYLSERDAIELPSDKFTMEETNDPDIKNRFCSICGYQGKWISEMIRHKRVHTNERPFKCKYCDRTSKWKADLIRHVSKVHGIRVVSKYSRSHTFDSDASVVKALKEAHRAEGVDGVSDGSMISDVVSEQGSITERCDTAELEQQRNDYQKTMDDEDDEDQVIEMTDDDDETAVTAENNLEFQRQNFIYQQHQQQLSEFAQQLLLAHMASLAAANSSAALNSGVPMTLADLQLQSPTSLGVMAADLKDVIGNKQITGALEKYITIYQSSEGEPILKCRICPYETRDLHTFRAHTQKHENKKPYQCSACGYRSNWSSDVHKHIRLKKTGHDRAFVIKLNENECSPPILPTSGGVFPPSLSPPPTTKIVVDRPTKLSGQLVWKCAKCDYVNDCRSELIDHLSKSHNSPPYACRFCNFSSLYRKTCVYHSQSQHAAVDASNCIVENVTFECRNSPRSNSSNVSDNADVRRQRNSVIESLENHERNSTFLVSSTNNHNNNYVGPPPNVVVDKNKILLPFKRSYHSLSSDDVSPLPAPKFMRFSSEETKISTSTASNDRSSSSNDNNDENVCPQCPFVSSTPSEMVNHRKSHIRPNAGLMCYKCVFCEWYAKKKTIMFDHLKLHTADPTPYMAEVERNLITPLANKSAADDDNVANALRGVGKTFKCDRCTFTTNFDGNLEKHHLICHNNNNNEPSTALDLSNGNKIVHKTAEIIPVNGNSTKKLNGPPSSSSTGFLHFKDISDVMSDFNAFLNDGDNEEGSKMFFRQLQSLTNEEGHFAIELLKQQQQQQHQQQLLVSPSMMPTTLENHRKFSSENNHIVEHHRRFVNAPAIVNKDDDTSSDHDETVDPEAYIHAGEEGLGDEQLFAEMVPKDIQKVNAMVDGQMRKMWQCRYCSHVSKRRANIRMHEKKHFKPNAVGLLKCPKCNYRGDKRSLKVHYRAHVSASDYASGYSQRFSCSHCPATFRKREVLDVHLAFHGGHNRYRCTQCSYAVPSQQQLTQHAQVHKTRHTNGNGNVTSTSSALYPPSRNNTIVAPLTVDTKTQPQKIHVAKYAPTSSSSSSSFVKLNEIFSSSPPTNGGTSSTKPKKLQCRFCSAKFTDRTQIQRHEHFHGVNLKYKCHLCNYSVPFPINLTKHLKSHHGAVEDNNDTDDDSEDNVTAQLESEAYDQYLQNPQQFSASCTPPPSSDVAVSPSMLNGLKMKINLGKLTTQSV